MKRSFRLDVLDAIAGPIGQRTTITPNSASGMGENYGPCTC